MTLTVTEAGRALTDASSYADEARLHEALTLLRREAPVHWVEADGFDPFWAVTRHADITEIERNHALFRNAPRPLLATAEMDAVARQREAEGIGLRTLIHMDDPQHRVVRAIGADWFRPRAMRAMGERIAELARQYVDRMGGCGGECDFASEIAVHYPLYVILSLLGLPESDFPRLLRLTQELFGGDDPELQRGTTPDELLATLLDFFGYFQGITAARRANPTGDLASAIANARVDGEFLSDIDVASYYVIIATAGHDTTSSTIAGGLHALVEHPAELDRLRESAGSPRSRSSCGPLPPTPRWPGSRSRRARRCCCPTPRATGTRRCSATRSGSTSGATRTSTSRSGSACTTASAPRWPGWRPVRCSPSCCPAWSPSSWPGGPSGPPPRSSAGSSTCPSATG